MVQVLLLDSRQRSHGSVHNATFLLPRPITRESRFRVKSLQFVNTFNNITNENNIISTNSGDIVIPEGNYTADELVNEINTQLIIGQVTLDHRTNILSWDINSGIIDTSLSTVSDILGFDRNVTYTQQFQTRLFLALPQMLSFICDRFGSDRSTIIPESRDQYRFNPFITLAVSSAYLEQQTYTNERNEHVINLDRGGNGVDIPTLTITAVDPYTRRQITELTHWAMLLEFI